MHVAELLASHGASLNAKTFLEETPIGKIHNPVGRLGIRSSPAGSDLQFFLQTYPYKRLVPTGLLFNEGK